MSFNESLGDTVRNSFCTALGAINNFNDWFSRLPYGESNLTRSLAQQAYRSLCNREPPPEPDPLVPGGQCPGVGYKWQVQFEWSGNAYDNNWLPETISNFTQPNTPGAIGALYISGGAGNWKLCFTSAGQEVIVFSHTSGSPTGFRNYRFTQVYRADGLPDTCGVVPAPVPPPTPNYNTDETTVTYNDYSNTSVDVDLNITFGSPQLTIDGDINIPVRIFSPDVNIPISGNFSVNNPEFNFNFGDSNYSSNNSSDGSDYDSPTDTPEVPTDVPCPVQPTNPFDPDVETRRTIRGVIVTVIEYPDDFGFLFQEENPDIPLPNFGYISFLCQIGSNAAWTIDLPVKNRRNLIEVPWTGGAIAVRGTPRPGVNWVLSEVYAVEQDLVTFEV